MSVTSTHAGESTSLAPRDLALLVFMNLIWGLNLISSKIGVGQFPLDGLAARLKKVEHDLIDGPLGFVRIRGLQADRYFSHQYGVLWVGHIEDRKPGVRCVHRKKPVPAERG